MTVANTTLRPIDLVATDLDGTFLSTDSALIQANIDAKTRANAEGVRVVFATGRPSRFIDPLLSLDFLEPLVISCNGGMITNLSGDDVIKHYPCDPDATISAFNDLRRHIPDLLVGAEYLDGWGRTPGFPEFAEFVNPTIEGDIPDLIAHADVVKIMVKSYSHKTPDLGRIASQVVGDRLTCTYSFPDHEGMIELTAAGVTKGTALDHLLASFAIDPCRVAAFGDMPNDADMLAKVGYPFVMAGAHPQLHEIGFPVAGNNDDGAVGLALDELLNRGGQR